MRSTGIVLHGLTAAASLALVAIFALPGFPLLAPAPLPNGPAAGESVAGAEKVAPALASRAPVAAVALTPAPSTGRGSGGPSVPGSHNQPTGTPEGAGEVGTHSPVSAPEPSPEAGGNEPSEGEPTATVAPTPVPTPVPTSTPSQSSDHSSSQEGTGSSPTTATADSNPGKSKSHGSDSHASDRGVEASSGHDNASSGHDAPKATPHPSADPPPAPHSPAAAPPEAPAPPVQPEESNGKALAKGKSK